MLALLETASEWWSQWMVRSLVQGSLAFLLACALWISVRRFAPPEFGCRLFLLVLVGLALPLSISAPPSVAERIPWKMQSEVSPAPPTANPKVELRANPNEQPAPALAADSDLPQEVTTTATLSSPIQPRTEWSWSMLLMLGWGALVTLGAIRMVWQQWQVSSLVNTSLLIDPEKLPFDFAKLKADARVPHSIGIYLSDSIAGSPAVCGLFRPKVLLPRELLTKLSPEQLQWTIAHELAHVRRGDLVILPLQHLVRLLFFFHPIVWLTHWIVGEFREHACDDEASTVSGVRSKASCEAFLNILEAAGGYPRARFGLVGFSTPVGPIQRRLMRMMNRKANSPHRLNLGYQAVIVLAGAIMLTHVRGRTSALPPETEDTAPLVGSIVLSPTTPIGETAGTLVAPASYSVEFAPKEGKRHEFRTGVQDYRVVTIDTREFSQPACLTLDVSVHNQEGTLGSFDLFPGKPQIPADGISQENFRDANSLGFAYDVNSESPKRISTFLKGGELFQLGATGSWGSPAGTKSRFHIKASVDQSYEALAAQSVHLNQAEPIAFFSDELPARGYRPYLVETTGFDQSAMLVIHVSFSESAGRGRLDLFDSSIRLPKNPTFHRSASTHAIRKLNEYSLVRGERIERRQDYIAIRLKTMEGGRILAAVAKPWGAQHKEGACEIRFQVRPLENH